MRRLCLLLLAVALLAIAFCGGAHYVQTTEVMPLIYKLSHYKTELFMKGSELSVCSDSLEEARSLNSILERQLVITEDEVSHLLEDTERLGQSLSALENEKTSILSQLDFVRSELAKYNGRPPAEFASLEVLREWLAQDDTDMQIPIVPHKFDCDDYTYMLVERAWVDGYIISPYFNIRRTHAMCTTKIGNLVYLIEPQTDHISLWGAVD